MCIVYIFSYSFLYSTNGTNCKYKIKKKIKGLADNVLEITPEDFFRIRNSSNGGRGREHISTMYDFSGVYIIYNHIKSMYYVGLRQKETKDKCV